MQINFISLNLNEAKCCFVVSFNQVGFIRLVFPFLQDIAYCYLFLANSQRRQITSTRGVFLIFIYMFNSYVKINKLLRGTLLK